MLTSRADAPRPGGAVAAPDGAAAHGGARAAAGARARPPPPAGKNFFVFAALIFGHKLATPAVWAALAGFVIFCGLSGAIYLFNDVADRDKDRRHPLKRQRPIASGRLPVPVAVAVGALLVVGGLLAGAVLSRPFLGVAVAYVVLLTAYSVWLKHVVIVDDVMTTGATLKSFARCLKHAEPASLSAIVVAVADPKRRGFEVI